MTIEEFAQTKLPSKRVVPLTAIPDISASRPDSISPDLADLRRKYFGDAEGSLAGAADAISRAARPTADTGIVLVAPSTPTADAGTSQVKAVVFSDGEESGRQG